MHLLQKHFAVVALSLCGRAAIKIPNGKLFNGCRHRVKSPSLGAQVVTIATDPDILSL